MLLNSEILEEPEPTPLRLYARVGHTSLLPYTKPFLSLEEQISLLIERGMNVPDSDQAKRWLSRIGYYRFSGYAYALREWHDGKVQESFRPGTEFKHVLGLYIFDKRLRLITLDAIERVEVALRVDVAVILGQIHPWAYRDSINFNRYFNEELELEGNGTITRHAQWLLSLDQLAERSKTDFAKHFFSKYGEYLPIWIAIELWDFGTLSSIINGLQDKYVQVLASKYQIPRRGMLVSWVQVLNLVRNACAHHDRLWNRALYIQPVMSNIQEMPILAHWRDIPNVNRRIYSVLCILQWMLKVISPSCTWGERLKTLVRQFPQTPELKLSASGFPSDWENEPLWASPPPYGAE